MNIFVAPLTEAAMYHHDRLRECFEEHLVETEGQIERLNECFSPA